MAAVLIPDEFGRPIERPGLPFEYDWKAPQIARVFELRADRLEKLRKRPGAINRLLGLYHDRPVHFINDWGVTVDPRNIAKGLPAMMPFILFPRQIELLYWILRMWRSGKRGLLEKSRGEGASWLAMALACTLCHFNRKVNIGFGSAKADKVDRGGDPDCLFWKGRQFMMKLPEEFRGSWSESDNAYMRVLFPDTESSIVGEAGDNIGRGGRTSITFVDEAAFLEHPDLTESSLADTTDCRIDISTPSGPAGSFAERRRALPADQIFTFHWRHDPRRDDAWYEAKKRDFSASTIARDYDISYAESLDFQLIPLEWIEVAVGAAAKLGIEPTGFKVGGLDVMDQGQDLNVFVGRHGISIQHCYGWTGRGIDIYATTQRAFELCAQHGYTSFAYDAVGVGAGVKGDARALNETRREQQLDEIGADPFFGSGEVFDPDGELVKERKNKDYFLNLKAQSWWYARLKFENTWRALNGKAYDAEMLISLDLEDPKELTQLKLELAQPTYGFTANGKVIVNKAPEGARSPNHADALVICVSPISRWMDVWARLAGD